MASIFTLDNIADFSEKLNIDELYEKKRQYDLNKLALFNKMLNRIHVRIKTTSRQKIDDNFCWYVVPELIIGVPKYDQGACIAYLMDKLTTNGFNVKYIHPNTLFISWMHFVPSYVRNELKKKTGIVINEYGKTMNDTNDSDNSAAASLQDTNTNPNDFLINKKDNSSGKVAANKKNYTPIDSYKPSGNLVYGDDLLSKTSIKLNK
jgi:hypothetical protein